MGVQGLCLPARGLSARLSFACTGAAVWLGGVGNALFINKPSGQAQQPLIAAVNKTSQPASNVQQESTPKECLGHPSECIGACSSMLNVKTTQRARSSWNAYYDDIAKFLLDRHVKHVVEIGTAWGGLAKRLLERLPQLELHAVDPFLPYDAGDAQSQVYTKLIKTYKLNATSFSATYAVAVRYDLGTRNGFGCRYVLHHRLSTDASSEFADGSLDAAFIDGLHTYEGVKADISAWHSKVRLGGILIFNDYGPMFPGVPKAVQEYALSTPKGLAAIVHRDHGNVYIERV